jgi:hypothetical protein
MNIKTLMKWDEQLCNKDEFGEFDRIPASEKLHQVPAICGLLKLASLLDPPAFIFNVGACMTGPTLRLATCMNLKNDITKDDYCYLLRCGIYADESGTFNMLIEW